MAVPLGTWMLDVHKRATYSVGMSTKHSFAGHDHSPLLYIQHNNACAVLLVVVVVVVVELPGCWVQLADLLQVWLIAWQCIDSCL